VLFVEAHIYDVRMWLRLQY